MTYSDQLLTRYMSLVKQPVSQQSRVGEDARFSSEFEVIESELAKAQAPYGAGPVDWARVRGSSEVILQTLSKDLRVTCWLTWALWNTESFSGLLAGCAMLHHLCQTEWESVFPRKNRTRAAALGWLVGRLEQVLAADVSVKDQLPLFNKLELYLQGIDEIFTAQMNDDAPLLLPVRRRLAVMVQRANEVEKPTVTVVEQVKQVAASLFSSSPAIDNDKDAMTALRAQQENARLLSAWWLRNKSTDLRALRLNRAVTWLAVEKIPECDSEQITSVRGLPADELKSYRKRFEQGNFADLMIDLEASLSRAPFWLDGQYWVWDCLRALKAEAAMREVELCLGVLLARLPGLTRLRFQGGAPFADADTRSWIAAHVTPHLQKQPEQKPVEQASAELPWDTAAAQALVILERDGIKTVARTFVQHIQRAKSERARFYWRFTLARLFHQAEKYELAKSQLEALEDQMKSSGVLDWEPDLYLDVLRLLYNCCERLPQNMVVREYKDNLYRRLCHLDIEAVLE